MRYALAFAALTLAGCGLTPEGDAARALVLERGARVYDAGIQNSITYLCDVASVAAVRREFDGRWDLYNALCAGRPVKLTP